MLYTYSSMCNYTSICTKNSLPACLLMHMQFNFIVCIMHSSGFLFQFTYLFIYLCCSWLSLNSFRSLLPYVLPFCSSALWFPRFEHFSIHVPPGHSFPLSTIPQWKSIFIQCHFSSERALQFLFIFILLPL